MERTPWWVSAAFIGICITAAPAIAAYKLLTVWNGREFDWADFANDDWDDDDWDDTTPMPKPTLPPRINPAAATTWVPLKLTEHDILRLDTLD
jgi:hypothetical protein